jgi:hypothetical protein
MVLTHQWVYYELSNKSTFRCILIEWNLKKHTLLKIVLFFLFAFLLNYNGVI